jgi:hypothetical protein
LIHTCTPSHQIGHGTAINRSVVAMLTIPKIPINVGLAASGCEPIIFPSRIPASRTFIDCSPLMEVGKDVLYLEWGEIPFVYDTTIQQRRT